MDVMILAAGYDNRIHPLTIDKAKPLLEIAGRPIIEWVLDNLADVSNLEAVYIVTNNKFANDFQAWAVRYQDRQPALKLKIIDDGSKSDDDNLGGIGDLSFLITYENWAVSNWLIISGNNVFNDSI